MNTTSKLYSVASFTLLVASVQYQTIFPSSIFCPSFGDYGVTDDSRLLAILKDAEENIRDHFPLLAPACDQCCIDYFKICN